MPPTTAPRRNPSIRHPSLRTTATAVPSPRDSPTSPGDTSRSPADRSWFLQCTTMAPRSSASPSVATVGSTRSADRIESYRSSFTSNSPPAPSEGRPVQRVVDRAPPGPGGAVGGQRDGVAASALGAAVVLVENVHEEVSVRQPRIESDGLPAVAEIVQRKHGHAPELVTQHQDFRDVVP